MPDHPQSDRLHQVADESNRLGAFLDWLSLQGLVLASWQTRKICNFQSGPIMALAKGHPSEKKWQCRGGRIIGHPQSNSPGHDDGPCERCWGTGIMVGPPELVTHDESPASLLARYYQVDLDALDEERDAQLAALRATRR